LPNNLLKASGTNQRILKEINPQISEDDVIDDVFAAVASLFANGTLNVFVPPAVFSPAD